MVINMRPSQYYIYSTSMAAWEAMRQAIIEARHSIYWEVYIFIDDEIGSKFFDLLAAKAKAGIEVRLIIDAWGSFAISRGRVQALRQVGVDVQLFQERKHRYRGLWKKIITRTHRKILVVDEAIGFIGGVNIDKTMAEWKDFHLRIDGSAVHSLLRAFAKSYLISGGQKSVVVHLLKYRSRLETDIKDIEFIFDEGNPTRAQTKQKYIEALLKARERVILFSPYYFPDRSFLRALWQARRRGVRVDLLIPFRTDVRLATYAAYSWFSLMQRYGVHVHLLRGMMHGKGVVKDSDWAMIGSSNLEYNSFGRNYEANVKIYDKQVVRRIKQTVLAWLHGSTTLDNLFWEKRNWWQRTKEWVARRLYLLWHK